ncbi:glycosyltransferase family 2 protein [Candidatus Roizmanbacteria bacterium]|nr:glycosyltransferase family 2 protein [Candidatus Roizmanbacteria bacterium]
MKVTVVIPAYNEEKHISYALEHLLNQYEKADEIIVVDNNSTDKTSEIAKKYGVDIIKEETQGMIPARNRGFNAAKYEIIARTDADTHVPKDWIKKIKENFIKNKDLVGLSGTTHFYDFPIHNKLQYSQWQNKAIFAFIKSQIKHATLYGPNMAIRKSAWEKIEKEVCLDDNSVHEDLDLAIHLGQHGNIKIDPRIIVDTSFRRWKKPHTYLEYSHRLLKTFRKHRLKKSPKYIHKVKSYTHEMGLIDDLWKEFKTSHAGTHDTAIIYLPGWSLSPSSKPVEKLCQGLAETLGLPTYAIQTLPQNIMANSLFYEAEAIKKLLQEIEPSIKRMILITHSQGTVKTIHLASFFQKDKNFLVPILILITPVGLYKISKRDLQIRFIFEIVKVLFRSAKEIIAGKKNKSGLNLTTSVIDYLRSEIRSLSFSVFMKRLDRQSHELTNSNIPAMQKLGQLDTQIIFVLAEKDFVSSVKKIKSELQKTNLKNIDIINNKEESHGMPYIQTHMVVQEIEEIAKNFLK